MDRLGAVCLPKLGKEFVMPIQAPQQASGACDDATGRESGFDGLPKPSGRLPCLRLPGVPDAHQIEGLSVVGMIG